MSKVLSDATSLTCSTLEARLSLPSDKLKNSSGVRYVSLSYSTPPTFLETL